jgi:diketogulonate reductase-like aldo/keto reductase
MTIEQRAFGATGKKIPVIGQGTWNMERDDRAACVRALRAGLDLGLTHVDTAEMYGRGQVEDVIAEAIHGRRDEVYLVSKVLPSNGTRAGTRRACEQSLARLKTDHLDCYLLHWPGSAPLADTIATFEDLKKEGKIRSWGVSNFDVDDLEQAKRICGGDATKIACNQVQYHLGARGIERDVLPWCEKHGIAVVGYSPFGVGRDFPSPSSKGGKLLAQIAAAHGPTVSVYQVALRFLIRRPSLFAIPKAADVAHVRDNAAAASLLLTAEELRRIEAG